MSWFNIYGHSIFNETCGSSFVVALQPANVAFRWPNAKSSLQTQYSPMQTMALCTHLDCPRCRIRAWIPFQLSSFSMRSTFWQFQLHHWSSLLALLLPYAKVFEVLYEEIQLQEIYQKQSRDSTVMTKCIFWNSNRLDRPWVQSRILTSVLNFPKHKIFQWHDSDSCTLHK